MEYSQGDVSMEKPYTNGTNGSLVEDEPDDDGVTQLFLAAIEHVMELEKRKAVIDEEESIVRSQLKEKHESEKSAIQESSELLAQKEMLRDKLISLKESREKLIDELNLFAAIDGEMKDFNTFNEQFNDSLKRHLALIENKQAKIYTLKPVITGVHVSTGVSYAQDERDSLNQGIVDAINVASLKIDEQISEVCNEYQIHKVDEWQKLINDEKSSLMRIKALKAKIREKQKEITRKQAKKMKESMNESNLDVDDEDNESTSRKSASVNSNKRSNSKSSNDLECEGCGSKYTDHEKFAYHCFRGCSRLEDLLKDLDREVTVDCHECGEPLTSFIGYTDHMKENHSKGKSSGTPKGGKRRRN